MRDDTDKPAICYETGLDESFLVGTKDELTALAHAILDVVGQPGEPLEYLGIHTRSTTCALTEVMAEVSLDGILVVEDKHDRQELINRIRINNGEPPIDWAGRKNRQTNRNHRL
jgi:hypothetical protein